MNQNSQNPLNFDNQNLVVDYITFKFQNSQCDQTKIANYLFSLGFNIYQESGKLAKPIRQPFLINSEKQYESCFVQDNLYWEGTLLHFTGLNAAQFYFLARENNIDWQIFEKATLSRFDINYSRKNKKDKISSTDFLETCYQKLKQTSRNVSLEKNRQGFILKIGNRKSNHYSRIYQGKDSLKFEYEMKGRFLHKFHRLLVLNNFEEMEFNLTKQFLYHFGKLLPLQSSYSDWLVVKLRPIRKQNNFQSGLNSEYIKSEIEINPKNLIQFIQFLNYAQNLDYTKADWERVSYRKVTFIVRDFIIYQDPTTSLTNRYQLQKTKDFFRQLQTGVLITSFSNTSYQSLIGIPRVTFERSSKHKYLIGNVWLVDALFRYQYSFHLPNFFQHKLTKDQFRVRFMFFQVFNSVSIEKEFLVASFLNSYPVKVSNQQKKTIKQEFIELVSIVQNAGLIDSHYKIMSNSKYYVTYQLTVENISEGFILYEKLNL